MDRIINQKNKKVHYAVDVHHTLCGMSDDGVPGFEKSEWATTNAQVDCRLCLKKFSSR